MEVRHATRADVPGIASLIDAHAGRDAVLRRTAESIWSTLPDFVVAVEMDEVMACGSLVHYSPLLAEIRSLAVDDRAQGNGCGGRLVRTLVGEAQRRGVATLFALTRAVPFFQKLGFSVSDKARFPEKVWRDCLSCPVQHRCDEWVMVLQLPPTAAGG